jgi:aspartate racemase
MNKLFGIIGGMGPIASAEFLKTIYEFNTMDREQESPACILYSDPTFPDRTDAIISGIDDNLLSLLVKVLENLSQLGVSRIIISCITTHYFLPKVPSQLRSKVISLVDLIIKEVLDRKRRHLLLCTNGSRKVDIFQRHPQWALVERYIALPDDTDQNRIHNIIYQLKKNSRVDSVISGLHSILEKYQVDSFIAGCTEIHLVTKHLVRREYKGPSYNIADPLLMLAQNLRSYLHV